MVFVDIKFIHLISHRLDKFTKLRDFLYNFRCPYCGDSEKYRNKARGYFYRVKDQMNFRCHNCDAGTTAAKVIQLIDEDIYKEYVKEKWIGEDEPEYQFKAPKFKKRDPKLDDLVCINKLDANHPALEFIKKRQIPEKHWNKFFLCHKFYQWSEIGSLVPRRDEHPRLVIPFYDEEGEVFAAQGRSFGNEQPKYLTVKFEDRPKIFGLDRVDLKQTVYVTEGPIDSLFIDNAIAVAGSDFRELPPCEAVIVLDAEPRSKEIVSKMKKLAEQDYELVIWPDNIIGKDCNEMIQKGLTSSQLCDIIKNNTFSGLEAQTRVSAWARI